MCAHLHVPSCGAGVLCVVQVQIGVRCSLSAMQPTMSVHAGAIPMHIVMQALSHAHAMACLNAIHAGAIPRQ